ncbi:hypothetical protein C8J57DRAFT_1532965 [Mycena rebaudengoi]|nr:hypothetical protein C8J57DRAFT_1532965 [Mycena rebaudengoi]
MPWSYDRASDLKRTRSGTCRLPEKKRLMFRCPVPAASHKTLQKSNIATHYRTHTGEKPCICLAYAADGADPSSRILLDLRLGFRIEFRVIRFQLLGHIWRLYVVILLVEWLLLCFPLSRKIQTSRRTFTGVLNGSICVPVTTIPTTARPGLACNTLLQTSNSLDTRARWTSATHYLAQQLNFEYNAPRKGDVFFGAPPSPQFSYCAESFPASSCEYTSSSLDFASLQFPSCELEFGSGLDFGFARESPFDLPPAGFEYEWFACNFIGNLMLLGYYIFLFYLFSPSSSLKFPP